MNVCEHEQGETEKRKMVDTTDEARDILSILKARESNSTYALNFSGDNSASLMECYYFLGKDKEASPDIMKPHNQIGHEVRSCIIGFLFETVDYFGEDREIVAVAIDYLDRFLLTRLRYDNENIIPTNICENKGKPKVLDIYVLASLGLAIKLFSPSSGCPIKGEERKKLAELSKESKKTASNSYCYANTFFVPSSGGETVVYNGHEFDTLLQMTGGDQDTIESITKAEQNILNTLQWYVHPPTSFAFIHNIFRLLLPTDTSNQSIIWESLQDLAYFQAELALNNSMISRYTPSIIAVSAVSNSIHRHLISNLPQMSKESKGLRTPVVDKIKLLLYRIEKSLEISYEFDERVITTRGLLTNQLMEIWRRNNDSQIKVKKIDVQRKDDNRANRSLQQNETACQMWEQCLFMDNLDSIVQSNQKENDNGRKPAQETDLIAHYNKNIRPKLYQMSEKVQSSKSSPPGFCNSTLNSAELPTLCNLKDVVVEDICEGRFIQKLRQAQGELFTI
jgi:hypothetical protein